MPRGAIAAIVEATEGMQVEGEEEGGGRIGMGIAEESAMVHVTEDMLNGAEG